MILDCPKCSAKYNIADGAIPSEGRNVRCAACGHFWFQKPATSLVVTENDAENKERMRFQEEAKSSFGANSYNNKNKAGGKNKYEPPKAAHEQYRDRIFSKARFAGLFAVSTAWIFAFAILGSVILMLVANREAVVKKWPKSASLFAMLGTRANMYDLEITKIQVRSGQDTEGQRMVITGTIKSKSQVTKPLPYLRVTLVNEKNAKVATWLVDPGNTIISPMAEQAFETIRRPIPEGNLRALITFADPPRDLPNGQAIASKKHDTLMGDDSQKVINQPIEIEAKEIKIVPDNGASAPHGATNGQETNNADAHEVENGASHAPKASVAHSAAGR